MRELMLRHLQIMIGTLTALQWLLYGEHSCADTRHRGAELTSAPPPRLVQGLHGSPHHWIRRSPRREVTAYVLVHPRQLDVLN